jgi:hypothetical protein
MIIPPCRLLDDYLAHDLSGDDLARFTDHLAACPDCRRAVRESHRLARLLMSATTALELVPAGLSGRIEHQLRRARRIRVAAVAASLLAAAVALWQLRRPLPRPADPEPTRIAAEPTPPNTSARPAEETVRVTFARDAHVIVVPEKFEAPNVTFFWVYRGQRTASSPAPAPGRPPIPERNDL